VEAALELSRKSSEKLKVWREKSKFRLRATNVAISHGKNCCSIIYYFPIDFNFSGVTKVDANVEAQHVAVTCDEGVVVDILLAALMKWSASSGKSVKLA
jgi:hypothetical protein